MFIDENTNDAMYPQTSTDIVFYENWINLKEILRVALFPLSGTSNYLELGSYDEWIAAGKPNAHHALIGEAYERNEIIEEVTDDE